MRLAVTMLTVSAAFSGSMAAGQGLPDATYRCQLYSGGMTMHLGDIETAAGRYRGPAHDGNFDDWYPMKVTGAGTINWAGPMGGFESDGSRIVSSVLTLDGSVPAFSVTIQLESGNFTTVNCLPE